MTIFKTRHDKTIRCDARAFTTLDSKHTEFLRQFHDNETIVIPQLKRERAHLRARLVRDQTAGRLSIDAVYDLQDQIDAKTREIRRILASKRTYFHDNAKMVFDYFENKKNIDQTLPQQTANLLNSKHKEVQSFFKIQDTAPLDASSNAVQTANTMNGQIVTRYMNNVEVNFVDIAKFMYAADVCQICTKGELIPYEDEGIMICNQCAHNFPCLVENEKPSYKETPKEVCFYAYKRLNHFKEVLAQFQAKETTQINQDVIAKIQHQIKKERIALTEKTLSNEVMRDILRKLGYDSKFYEHIPFIKHKMGIKPLIMSRELEEDLYNAFGELQSPYFKHCPDSRENFLNYNYTAYKLCERLGHTEFLPHFHMIKDRYKLIEHDMIWAKMCAELGWQFIPTI